MTNASESGEKPGNPPASSGSLGPKRGAFPTPKSEIDKAKQYVPDPDQADDGPEMKGAPRTNIDEQEKG
jgi:hypothetical protein